MAEAVIPVVLSGGAGTRLWPLSREVHPKQLQKLYSSTTLLQETVCRYPDKPIIVCNDEHRFSIDAQLREAGVTPRGIIVEPCGRNTAPAVAIAALLTQDESDCLLLVMPSGHMVSDADRFREAVRRALPLAREGRFDTFGVEPTGPHTGYGYIRRGPARREGGDVARFVGKPAPEVAEAHVQSVEYYWNSGIFLLSPSEYLAELETLRPEMVAQCRKAMQAGRQDLFFFRLDPAVFSAIHGESIDYAVMENTRRAAVVPLTVGWSDIGSWSTLWQECPKDENGNVEVGDVLSHGAGGCYLRSENGRLAAAAGVRDMVVVATDDAVLVAGKEADQDVKAVVETLKVRKRTEASQGRRAYRPWGWFQTIDEGSRFRVKHIQVEPGAKLSLQEHWHRSEHWVVVTGIAIVTRGEETLMLWENESVFISAGRVHRLENPGRLPLRLIEVQSGEYVGEDDIVRVEDVCGRLN